MFYHKYFLSFNEYGTKGYTLDITAEEQAVREHLNQTIRVIISQALFSIVRCAEKLSGRFWVLDTGRIPRHHIIVDVK